MSNAKNVSTAKPQVGGAIYTAPPGTILPTDAITGLDEAFKNLGYVSEDGMTNANEIESEDIKAWGGETVANVQTSKEDSFTYTLIEVLNTAVLKEIYGESNVTGDLETGIKIKVNNKELEEHCIVVDMILHGNILKRIVIPAGKVSEIGEISYKDDEAIGYETTIKCIAFDNEGNTHFEYIQKAPAGSSGGGTEGGDD